MRVRNPKREIMPLFERDLNIILNPKNIVQPGYEAKPITLLEFVLRNLYEFNIEKYAIPLLKKIKETGRELSPDEQEYHDNFIEEWKEYHPELESI
jgi:hypothetical protein